MSFSADPIRLHSRFLPRRWGRKQVASWCADNERPSAAIGEIWLAHPYNVTPSGAHFGAILTEEPQRLLGELGRAPPSLRLIITDEPSDPIASHAPAALWRMLESPLDGVVHIYDEKAASPRELRCRRGDLLRVADNTQIVFAGGVTALEARATFVPNNQPNVQRAQRLLSASEKKHRTTWLRDPAMSVELWTLPEVSFLQPDGETCHVLTALSPGAAIDGEPLTRGDSVFLPANGRRATLTGKGAQVVVAYPDLRPTEIWKHVHAPKPAALAIDPQWLAQSALNAASGPQLQQRAAAA